MIEVRKEFFFLYIIFSFSVSLFHYNFHPLLIVCISRDLVKIDVAYTAESNTLQRVSLLKKRGKVRAIHNEKNFLVREKV